MKTLIEIHVLQNFAPSNLNRDDTGAPKDAFFGGTRRARISSQCLKRAVRDDFMQKVRSGLLKADELAVRTKRLYQAIGERLEGKRDTVDVLAKAKTALSYVKLKAADGGKTEYLLFLGQKEIAAIAEAIDQHWDEITSAVDDPKDKGKAKSKKVTASEAPEEVREKIKSVFDGGKAIDLALFGRMLADMPDKNQNAACQVAHAISTHTVQREFDYYTAVDDLSREETPGADMIGTVDFNSACFYRYAAVDCEKLTENLQDDEELARKGLRAFLDGFVVAEPTGKQNSFAAHNPPEFVAVSVRRNVAPRNLANAFEMAIPFRKEGSLSDASAERLMGKAKDLDTAYDGKGTTFVLNLTGATVDKDFGTAVTSLKDLLDKTIEELSRKTIAAKKE